MDWIRILGLSLTLVGCRAASVKIDDTDNIELDINEIDSVLKKIFN